MPRLFADGTECLCVFSKGLFATVLSIAWATQILHAQSPSARFDADQVREAARQLAAAPYKAPVASGIRVHAAQARRVEDALDAKPVVEASIAWPAKSISFVLKPIPSTPDGRAQMDLYLVEEGRARHYAFDQAAYERHTEKSEKATPRSGFAGLRFFAAKRQDDGSDQTAGPNIFAVFHANGLYEATGLGQVSGPTARPLKVRWQDNRGEETPHVRIMWVERPVAAAPSIVVHTLLDAPSLAAACQFALRPGDATIVDSECTAFLRTDIEQIGFAAMHGAHYIGPMAKPISEDARPAASEVSGLRMLTGDEEWIWRPVANRTRLEVSSFVDKNPRGYGLVQQQRELSAFLDDENQWHNRPTVWVEPVSDWGEGNSVLQEIPASYQHNKNIIVYWRPKTQLDSATEVNFAYRQYWGRSLPDAPQVATVNQSRSGKIAAKANKPLIRFLVQFAGGELDNESTSSQIQPVVTTTAGKIVGTKIYRTPENGTCRVVIDLDVAGETVSELRLQLIANGTAKSETWLYRWTQ